MGQYVFWPINMFGWSFALLYDHCIHFHMTVWCMIKLLICFISCLLNRNLLVTLYLPFYYLLYLEGLMCFVQVFQVTGIHVPSSSQLLDLGVSEFYHCSQLTFKSRVCYRVFCYGIAKRGDCKVVIYNYVLCWLYSMTKYVVIVLIYFLIFCGILLYWV